MKVIFEEYSGIIIIGCVIVALLALVGILLASGGPVHDAFINLIDGLFSQTGISAATPTPTP